MKELSTIVGITKPCPLLNMMEESGWILGLKQPGMLITMILINSEKGKTPKFH